MTHDLISSYGLLSKMKVLSPRRATPDDMKQFHSNEYVNFLQTCTFKKNFKF